MGKFQPASAHPGNARPLPIGTSENHKLSFFIMRTMQNGSCLKAPASLHDRPCHSQNPSPSLCEVQTGQPMDGCARPGAPAHTSWAPKVPHVTPLISQGHGHTSGTARASQALGIDAVAVTLVFLPKMEAGPEHAPSHPHLDHLGHRYNSRVEGPHPLFCCLILSQVFLPIFWPQDRSYLDTTGQRKNKCHGCVHQQRVKPALQG